MKARSRVLIWIGVVVACFSATPVVYHFADQAFRRSMHANYEFKRMHVAPGTIVNFTDSSQIAQRTGGKVLGEYTVCFSIDSFSDVPSDLQAEYADAERARVAKQGPECITAHDQSGQIRTVPGDSIEVYYLLYGNGKITVEGVVVHGQELQAM